MGKGKMVRINKVLIILLLLISFLLTGCSTSNKNEYVSQQSGPDSVNERWNEPEPDDTNKIGDEKTGGDKGEKVIDPEAASEIDKCDSIEVRISNMTVNEKIGQMFIVGFTSIEMDKELEDLLETRTPGGVILFKRNIKDSPRLLKLLNSIKMINKGREPLFISVDEEGGRVGRMPPELHALPSAESLGEYGDTEFTYELGAVLAQEVKAFGINMDFAPVLDIWSNPLNKVISDRAFGTTVETVSRHGIELMNGIQDNGIVPVVKHFPGHGDTSGDSHAELPAVNHSMDRLAGFELVPFQNAIDSNADAVMVGHLLVNNIDPENPATLSKAVMTDLLRNEMRFTGVVITDDMTMDAISKNYNIGEAVVKSVIAGSDIILVCHDYDKQAEAMDAVRAAVEKGIISEKRIDESVARILRLKDKYAIEDQTIEYIDIAEINKKIDGLMTRWYNK